MNRFALGALLLLGCTPFDTVVGTGAVQGVAAGPADGRGPPWDGSATGAWVESDAGGVDASASPTPESPSTEAAAAPVQRWRIVLHEGKVLRTDPQWDPGAPPASLPDLGACVSRAGIPLVCAPVLQNDWIANWDLPLGTFTTAELGTAFAIDLYDDDDGVKQPICDRIAIVVPPAALRDGALVSAPCVDGSGGAFLKVEEVP